MGNLGIRNFWELEMKRDQANSPIDREARDRMAYVAEQYLNEEITAFEFDDALELISSDTEDKTVHEIRLAFWGAYDDLTDHKVVASKESWDFFQRLLLILKSNARIEMSKRRRWTVRQSIAISLLSLFLAVVVYTDFGVLAYIVYIGVGVVSLGLAYWRGRLPEPGAAMEPFSSLMEIVKVRKSVPSFLKQSYPGHLKNRSLRSGWEVILLWWPIYGTLWFIVGPLMLLVQSFPEDFSKSSVVLED